METLPSPRGSWSDAIADERRCEQPLRTLSQRHVAPALLLAAIDAVRGENLVDIVPLVERGLAGVGLSTKNAGALLPQAFAALIVAEELDRAASVAEEMLSAARARGSLYYFLAALGTEHGSRRVAATCSAPKRTCVQWSKPRRSIT